MTVSIVTDSAASLPKDLSASWGIEVVPMGLTIGEHTYRDGEIDLEEVMARVDEGVTTSGPPPGDFVAALETAGFDDGALVVTIAETMSATAGSARLAAQATDVERVRVLDSGTAAGAEGLVALAAAREAAAGSPLDRVEQVARQVADKVHLVATVSDLERLAASGRVPDAAAWAGRLLGLQPLFEFRGGSAHPLRPVRSRERALDHIVDRWRRSRPDEGAAAAGVHVAALHALAEGPAQALLDRVEAEVEPRTEFVGAFSPVMVAHTGPALAGLAWYWDDAPAS